MVGTKTPKIKSFKGANQFRQRIVLSTLSSTPVRITNIRDTHSTSPGLAPSEICFIRLVDKITSGAVIQINETGTTLTYKPGILIGCSPTMNEKLTHECHISRAISYYLQPILILAPFCKHAIHLTVTGATHSEMDISIDTMNNVSIPLLRRLTQNNLLSPNLQVKKRSMQCKMNQNGGGQGGLVTFRCDVLTSNKIQSIDLIDFGVIKRVRGIVYGNRINPNFMNQLIDKSRGVLNQFSPDIYIHTDHCNVNLCGVGYGFSLLAESTNGEILGSDWSCAGRNNVSVENVAQATCNMLLEEIENGGCVDSNHVGMALTFAAIADSDLSRIRIGKLNDSAVILLRDLELFFGVRFNMRVLGSSVPEKLREGEDAPASDSDSNSDSDSDSDSDSENKEGHGIIMSCIGVGLANVARQRF